MFYVHTVQEGFLSRSANKDFGRSVIISPLSSSLLKMRYASLQKSPEVMIKSFLHGKRSFIHSGYLYSPLQETYTESLSVQLRPKRNVLRSLQKEDTLYRCSKRTVGGSLFQVGSANNRESSKMFKRRANPRNQELTTSRRTKNSTGN